MSEDPTSNAPFPSSQFRDDRNKPVRHIAPSSGASIDSKTTWFLHALASSRTYLANQPSYRDIEEGIKLIEEESPRIRVNRLKRQMREVVASLSQIRVQGWTVRTDNRDFDNQAGDITKLLAGWFHETNVTRRIRSAMQWACATGTGYLSPRYDPAYHTATRGDVELDVLGAQDVFPVQLPKSGDLQAAYAVMMRTQIGTEDARNRYPEFAQDIQADPMPRQSQSSRALRVMAHLVSPLKAFMGNEPGSPSPAQAETVSLFQVYIRDSTINNSGNDISMGTGNWQYTVPPLGKLIPSGFRDPEGHMTMRKAGPADCRLYPTRRLMVFLGSIAPVLVYDNASPHWFAKVPLVRFRVDDWPWLSLGFSLAHDGRSLQKAHTSIMDSIIQAVKCRLDPHLTYTKQAFSKTAIDSLDLHKPGGRLAVDGLLQDNPIKPTLPPDYYSIQEGIVKEIIPYLDNAMDYLTASRDMTAMAKARQIPSADSIEKLLEMAGPVTRDISDGMRHSLMELGSMVTCMLMQWTTLSRRVRMLGPDGIEEEEFDFSPAGMVPSHMAWEDTRQPSQYSIFERGVAHLNNFMFYITPGSLHEITQTSRQLLLLQLYKLGLPIDPWTLMEAFAIPNVGPPPLGTKSVIERWVDWNYLKAGIAARIESGMPQQQEGRGRKPTNQKAPHVETKDNGTRSTIATS